MRTLVAAALVALIAVFAGAEAFGALPLGGTAPALSPTPNLSVSTPSLPSVSTPSLPSVSAPSSSVPSTPSLPGAGSLVGRVGSSAGGAAGGVSGVASLVPRATVGSSGATAASASGSGGSGSSGGGNGGSGAQNRHSSSSSTAMPAEYRGRAGERRLRADVRRLASCLGALPSLEQRVLAARAGIGMAPMSRSDAAKHLHISRDRELAAERHGIEDLESAAGAGGCEAESGPVTLSARSGLIASHLGAVPQLQPSMLLSGRPSLETTVALAGGPHAKPLSGVEAASASGGSATLASGSTQIAGTQPSIAHPQYLIALLLAALLVGGLAALRRRRDSREAYAPAAHEPTPVAAAPPPADEVVKDPIEVSWTHPVTDHSPAAEAGAGTQPNGPGPATSARRAAVIAAGLASLAITGILRRRR